MVKWWWWANKREKTLNKGMVWMGEEAAAFRKIYNIYIYICGWDIGQFIAPSSHLLHEMMPLQ